jgi:RNA polymerase sigma factor (sigma-70 family)
MADVAECYEKHADALIRFAATMVGPSDAEDVVSAAVIGVLRVAGDDITDLRAYLYRSVANAARKHWRSLDRRVRRERLMQLVAVVEEADEMPEIARALASLSPQQRAVVHLIYWEDLTPAMTATRLGVGEGTVKRQLARSRQRLAEVLHDHAR